MFWKLWSDGDACCVCVCVCGMGGLSVCKRYGERWLSACVCWFQTVCVCIQWVNEWEAGVIPTLPVNHILHRQDSCFMNSFSLASHFKLHGLAFLLLQHCMGFSFSPCFALSLVLFSVGLFDVMLIDCINILLRCALMLMVSVVGNVTHALKWCHAYS